MKQLSLFSPRDSQQAGRRGSSQAPAWSRLHAIPGKAAFLHASGWRVLHCGHATANWPYYLESPGRPEIIVSHNGRGFRTSTIARIVVERILAGELVISTNNCAPGIASVNVDAAGEQIRS